MNATDEKTIFGNNLLVLITQRNWTIQQAAIELGYNRNSLSQILVGSKNFRLETAIKFAKYFDISLFLLFSRLFKDNGYRTHFRFVDADYMDLIRKNFRTTSTKQSEVQLDPTTVSHIMHGKRSNLTINTLCQISSATSKPLAELLKTDLDKEKENYLKEDDK